MSYRFGIDYEKLAEKKLTKRVARKVLEVIDAGLSKGLGKPQPGQMCVMAAINYATGGNHGDKPTCVHPVIRRFDIALNDADWSSRKERAKGMRREAIAKLGSTEIDGFDWTSFVRQQILRLIIPELLRHTAKAVPSCATEIETASSMCAEEDSVGEIVSLLWSASHKFGAGSVNYYHLVDAIRVVELLKESIIPGIMASNAARAAIQAGRILGKRDDMLKLAAEIATDACIKVKTQGSKWLDICE